MAYGEVEVLFPYSLTLTIRWRGVGRLNALAASPGTHCLGGYLGLRPDQDPPEKIKLLSVPGIEPQFLDSPVHNLITLLTEPSWSVCVQ